MDTNLLKELKRCSNAEWFGYSEGSWVGEEMSSNGANPLELNSKLMNQLKDMGHIEDTGKVTQARSGILVIDWRVTEKGAEALKNASDDKVLESN